MSISRSAPRCRRRVGRPVRGRQTSGPSVRSIPARCACPTGHSRPIGVCSGMTGHSGSTLRCLRLSHGGGRASRTSREGEAGGASRAASRGSCVAVTAQDARGQIRDPLTLRKLPRVGVATDRAQAAELDASGGGDRIVPAEYRLHRDLSAQSLPEDTSTAAWSR